MAQATHSFKRTSAVVIILPFVGHEPGIMGLDSTTSLPFLPISFWFLIYIFSYGISFQLIIFFLINSLSVNNYNFGVPMGLSSSVSSYSTILATSLVAIYFYFISNMEL